MDWTAVADRLEAAIAERGLAHEPGARDAVAHCRQLAMLGAPPGPFMRRPDPLLDFCRRYGLSLDAIVLGYR